METRTFPKDIFSCLDIIHENGLGSCKSRSEYIIHAVARERKRTEELCSCAGPREIQAVQVIGKVLQSKGAVL